MQLKNIRLQGLDDIRQCRIIGIDRQRDLQRTASNGRTKFARRAKADVTRRGLEKYEAHHVGACL